MSNTRVVQAHTTTLVGGEAVPARVDQAHKVVLLTIGSVPSVVTTSHKVVLVTPTAGRRRGFMNFRPEEGEI